MSGQEKLDKMNRLFAKHDSIFRSTACDTDLLRELDSKAQALKDELIAEGHTLVWSAAGYASFAKVDA